MKNRTTAVNSQNFSLTNIHFLRRPLYVLVSEEFQYSGFVFDGGEIAEYSGFKLYFISPASGIAPTQSLADTTTKFYKQGGLEQQIHEVGLIGVVDCSEPERGDFRAARTSVPVKIATLATKNSDPIEEEGSANRR